MKLNFFSKKEGMLSDHVERSEEAAYSSGKKPKETWREQHMAIRLSMILYISWKNLKVNRTRSMLTIGGVALGIGIITFLLSIGFGVQEMIVQDVTKNNPTNVIDLSNGSLDNFVALNTETVEKIKNIEGIEKIESRINAGGKMVLGELQTDVVIYGTTSEYLDMSRINYKVDGGNFSNDGDNAIVSDRLANLLGFNSPADAIGKTVTYNIALNKDISSQAGQEQSTDNTETTISGVITGTTSAFLYLPSKMLREKFNIDAAQEGKVVVGNMEKFDNIKQQLEQMGFVTDSVNELITQIDSFFNTIRAVLVIFGIIIMSISVMGMLNTLSVSLLQRTKEIGILKALGTKRADVFKMFVLESIIISFVGGILGFFGGFGFALLANKILVIFGSRVGVELSYFVYVPPIFIIVISCFIIFLGIATGIMPAFRAAKIHALEALRYE